MFTLSRRLTLTLLTIAALTLVGCSQDNPLGPADGTDDTPSIKAAPPGYYDTVDTSTPAALRATLHGAVDDHTKIPYTSTSTDTWNVLELADQDPNNSGRILDVYLNESYVKYGEGNLDYNREHTWPSSYGFPSDGSTNYPYTDCHHLFLCNDSYNSSRGNKPYGTAGATGTERPTVANDGVGGGSGVYPGWSNWYDVTYWETWADRRGDVARALFYLDVRYEGGNHGVTGYAEPDLILTDNLSLIEGSNTGSNGSVAYMGLLTVLLQWHAEDPVDAKEMWRNDQVYTQQGNRNPFIDHPEWAGCVFAGDCTGGGDTTPPAAPTALIASGGDGTVNLDWADNGETDLAGYSVYRATASGGPFNAVNGTLLTASSYTDGGLTNGTTYWYVVTATDGTGNESASSAEAGATPAAGGGGGTVVWINEFHYDNDGTDTGEFFEIAGTAGTSLAGWSVVGYNGNGGVVYDTEVLSGTLPDQQAGFGTLSFAMVGMQNGSPDGLALVDDGGAVVEFISYEGTITGADGPAAGLTSTNVVVSETSTTTVGHSLQLAGTGTTSADFTWQAPQANTSGAVNTGQTFEGGVANLAPTAEANGPYAGEAGMAVSFSSAGSSDPDGAITGYAWTFGDGGTSTLANPSHAYAAPGNYSVTLTVTDDQGATGGDTATASILDTTAPATPTGLAATAGDGSVDLDWADNTEGDLAGYTVHRATVAGGPYTALNGTLLTGSVFTDGGVTNGTAYYYVVTATDGSGNASGYGSEASATPAGQSGGGDADVWINEFHYDNDGTDTGEFFEIAGTAGTNLAGWSVVGYNGNGGIVYDTELLSGTLPDLQGGFGVLSFPMVGMQNGSPDGLALVDGAGAVVMFLSYEGVIVAGDGPAVGLTSVDIGVSEASVSTVGHTLQLAGTGSVYGDFTWQWPAAGTSGAVNTGQTLGDGTTNGAWQTITYDDFESGLGSYTDGGGDMSLYTSGTYAHEGSNAADIQDNSGVASSFFHTTGHNVSGYTDLEVDFWYMPVSMDRTGEDFWVQYWDGTAWLTVATFNKGVDFENKIFYHETVTIPAGTFDYPTDAKLRFMCDASGNVDDVYIDEIEFRGFSD